MKYDTKNAPPFDGEILDNCAFVRLASAVILVHGWPSFMRLFFGSKLPKIPSVSRHVGSYVQFCLALASLFFLLYFTFQFYLYFIIFFHYFHIIIQSSAHFEWEKCTKPKKRRSKWPFQGVQRGQKIENFKKRRLKCRRSKWADDCIIIFFMSPQSFHFDSIRYFFN
jgi:hypothetical protein